MKPAGTDAPAAPAGNDSEAGRLHKEERRRSRKRPLLDREIASAALRQAALRLDPRSQLRNPVMFVVEAGAILVTLILAADVVSGRSGLFAAQIALWLWFTVVFANFAEAMAEGRGKAQAESLRRARTDTRARRVDGDGKITLVMATMLRRDDVFEVSAGDTIPADGTVIEGAAYIDESAITGESAPVIRECGGDRSGVTGGTRVLSDTLRVRVTAPAGESFLDRMVNLVESARRQKTPNEIALTVLITGLTMLYLVVVVTLVAFASYTGTEANPVVLVALLVCLIPTTIGGLLGAIGIAGMDRLMARNVVAKSGRAIEAAGDIDAILLDKTGTITLGNRQAVEFIPVGESDPKRLRDACLLGSLHDLTPEGRSIVKLAEKLGGRSDGTPGGTPVEFTAETRMSGIDLPGRVIRKGAPEAVEHHVVREFRGTVPEDAAKAIEVIGRKGGTPLTVSENGRVLGVIHLKDVLKPGIAERLSDLKTMGIRTVMITGDNPVTAATVADEAGVDEFIAEARPEDKLAYIRHEQQKGQLVAMIGDGTNDSPALAQADVGLAMNSGSDAAREAGNMVDLDSSPTKLIDVIETGKQLLVTRGALTTFSIANDVAKYFAIIPAIFPSLPIRALNIMGLHTAESAVLSAVIFNAIIIILLIPLALKGVKYRPASASSILRRNTLVYGLGGIAVPFIGIKLIDMLIAAI